MRGKPCGVVGDCEFCDKNERKEQMTRDIEIIVALL